MKISLAAALLRRKELNAKVAQLHEIDKKELYEIKLQRRQINETVDDIAAQVPKLKPEDVTSAYDWHARRLREIDLIIQQANHATIVEIGEEVMADYKTPEKK